MEIEQIEEEMFSLMNCTSERMRRYIHYNSMRNFIYHFSEINDRKTQQSVMELIAEYLSEIKMERYNYDRHGGAYLAKKYLFTIAKYYRKKPCGFRNIMNIEFVFLYGLMIDSLLLFGGILADLKYVPIITLTLLMFHIYIVIFKERFGRMIIFPRSY